MDAIQGGRRSAQQRAWDEDNARLGRGCPAGRQRRAGPAQQDVPGAGQRVLLAGLGNPGRRYAGNRHNVGFMVLDELATRAGGKFKAHKAGAEVLEARIAGRGTVLAKPRSYMNVSGEPVAAVCRFFKLDVDQIVVIHDDLDIPYGAVRLKRGGGDNGHNGLLSITKSVASNEYYRVRFGVGRPSGRMDPAEFVLRDFATTERRDLALHVDRCADAVEVLLDTGLAAAQNTFHAR